MYKLVDLFAGAGGLSLGFAQTKKFEIKAAFENSPYMKETYKLNHPGVKIYDDVCKADYSELKRAIGDIDVVIGGPPCQGFSNANRQRNTTINQNNMLVKQFIRAIIQLQPRAFVMENVGMLRSETHRFYITHSDESIVMNCQIPFKVTQLTLLSVKYIFDDAIEIIQNKDAVEQNLWSDEEYQLLNVIYKASKNYDKLIKALVKHKRKLVLASEHHIDRNPQSHIQIQTTKAFSAIGEYYAGTRKADTLKDSIEPSILIQRMLRTAKELHDNDIIIDEYNNSNGIIVTVRSVAVLDYITEILKSEDNNYAISYKVLSAADFGVPQRRNRFIMIGIKNSIAESVTFPEGSVKVPSTVRDAIEDLEDVIPHYNLDEDVHGIKLDNKRCTNRLWSHLRDSDVLRNHIVTKTSKTALERFRALKQGQNFHSLSDDLKTNTYTDASRTQNTIYCRLSYDAPSGTVVNVRKSMWIHPTIDRAVSVREAARLQTFPNSYVFCGTKDKQYQQVGNAVPPMLAKAIADKLANTLSAANCPKGNNHGR